MRHKPKLFPYAMVRIAGGSIEDLESLTLRQTIHTISELAKTSQQSDKLRDALSDSMHTFIGTVNDKKVRNQLIKLRRDLYNGKQVSDEYDYIKIKLPNHLQKQIEKVIHLHKNIIVLKLSVQEEFDKEMETSKNTYLKLLDNVNFRRGLVLANSALPEGIYRYKKNSQSGKRMPKMERLITKYLTRMYTKPSPFSTFTQIGMATFSDDKKVQTKLASYVHLNHLLFKHFRGLLLLNKEIRKELNLTMNITMHFEDGTFHFLTNNHNRESFQTIQTVPAVTLIFQTFQKQTVWKHTALVSELGKYVKATDEQLEAYIASLVEAGFLEYDLDISARDNDWDTKLVTYLTSIENTFPEIASLNRTLKQIKILVKTYESANADERSDVLFRAFELLNEASAILRKAAGISGRGKKHKNITKGKTFKHGEDTNFDLKPHNLWYEDSYFKTPLSLNPALEQPLSKLGILLENMDVFDSCTDEHLRMAYFFEKKYGKDKEVELLKFYEDYVNKMNKTKFISNKTIPAIHQRKLFKKRWLQKFMSNIRDQIGEIDQVKLTDKHIPPIPPGNIPGTPASYGVYFHALPNESGQPLIVVNIIAPGYGRLYSRFLELFDPAVTEEFRKENTNLAMEAILAEATDASYYNGNLHPRIAPYELSSPGSFYSLKKTHRIPITDIIVKFNSDVNRLELLNKKDKKIVYVYDLDFQELKTRSKLYQFLNNFSFTAHHSYRLITHEVEKEYRKRAQKNALVVTPRIVYEDQVILQRKRWLVHKSVLPVKSSEDTEATYFQKVALWRLDNSIPQEIFVIKKGEKPQYISFANPFTVALFERLTEMTTEAIELEEMLPTSQNKTYLINERKITEVLAQWYCRR